MKKFVSMLCALVTAFSLCGALTGCKGADYTYEPINHGTLRAPEVAFETAEENPTQNALFREKYPTLERYPNTVTVDVAAIQYNLEDGVKPGTTPYNQTFNEIALKALNIKINYTAVSVSTAYEQKLNLSIAANQMPDMFYTTSGEMFTMLRDTGMLAGQGIGYARYDIRIARIARLPLGRREGTEGRFTPCFTGI